jgi:anhydro-N-acetylmuramic acid kinase
MIVAGVMSGTSADGIDVALVRISNSSARSRNSPSFGRRQSRKEGGKALGIEFLGHAEFSYPPRVRRAILAAMNASSAAVADLARLNFLLGELYGRAVVSAERRFRVRAELVGCHGQTLYHQGKAASFLGHNLAVTWQTGEGGVVAARVGVPVVSDFRPADMAAGGGGAPLVPFLDLLLYGDGRIGRVIQNIGGIANLTAIPGRGSSHQVVAFDTGPGNMVIDGVTERLFQTRYDRDGKIASRGRSLPRVVTAILSQAFFEQAPPKTAGREQFGAEFTDRLIARCRGADARDIVATATSLTARSIAQALKRFVLKKGENFSELVAAGGGTRNPALMAMLEEQLRPLGLKLRFSGDFGIPSQAKEAVAFALLAYRTWHRQSSNLPSATGARREAILGKISYA